ncbi:hypothetical protein GOP47_0020112 [Adiantum capillus-veneris]|uniref:Uncharacterized protein n=1 Tax=Adiantum capillus-veneris TaxID=13818 RepID=A0A9D4UCU8_ADICA|nr:hypothetical protein GOP47_0020112 [Adiantum capillus-veneris]
MDGGGVVRGTSVDGGCAGGAGLISTATISTGPNRPGFSQSFSVASRSFDSSSSKQSYRT